MVFAQDGSLMKLKWSFSLILLTAYVAIFQLWLRVGPPWVKVSAILLSLALTLLLLRCHKTGYFANRWDLLIHASIILDILAEGLFLHWHEDHGFYLCAAAFAGLVFSYRGWLLRSYARRPSQAVVQ